MNDRVEQDALGTVYVASDSYGGSFYTRAKENFQISSLRAQEQFKRALGLIKKSAAIVNHELGYLETKIFEAILEASDEFIEGKFDDFFDLDVYQAGAGTPYNMTANEIIANRANEILGVKKGTYSPIHPNDHVNMSQSSNDVIPTAIRISALHLINGLLKTGENLSNEFDKKAKDFSHIVKLGRTHLQDAVPITLGQEFGAYASSIRHALARIDLAKNELKALGLGGTATGSGINTHPDFSKMICVKLSEFTGENFLPADNKFETTNSMAVFASVSSSINLLASELLRITNDIRLLGSGPKGGFNELILDEVEPGSSIMPGKVNPSVPECMSMICIQVSGLNHAIGLCAFQGQLQLNFHTPLIMFDLLHQIEIMTNGMNMLSEKCVATIKANESEISASLNRSTAMATALAPYMGYHDVAKLVQESLDSGVPISELVPQEFKKYLSAEVMTKPNRD